MTHRPFGLIGLTILVISVAVLVAGGLGWVTHSSLKVEADQRIAASHAEVSEKERLALWRLDGRIFPTLGLEGYRKYEDYIALFTPPGEPPGGSQYLSHLVDAEIPEWMVLHVQLDPKNGWSSPQVLPSELVTQLAASNRELNLANLTDLNRQRFEEWNRRFPASFALSALTETNSDLPDSSAIMVTAQTLKKEGVEEFHQKSQLSVQEPPAAFAKGTPELQLNPKLENKKQTQRDLVPPESIPSQANGITRGGRGSNPAFVGNSANYQNSMTQNGGRTSNGEVNNDVDEKKRFDFFGKSINDSKGGVSGTQQVVPIDPSFMGPPAPESISRSSDRPGSPEPSSLRAQAMGSGIEIPKPTIMPPPSLTVPSSGGPLPPGGTGASGSPRLRNASGGQGGGGPGGGARGANPPGGPGGPEGGLAGGFGGGGRGMPSTTPGMPQPQADVNKKKEAETKNTPVTPPAREDVKRKDIATDKFKNEKDDRQEGSKEAAIMDAKGPFAKALDLPLAVRKPAPSVPSLAVDLGPMRPKWLTDVNGQNVLAIFRPARLDGKIVYQGVWLDWDKLKSVLKEEVEDDFPESDLLPSKDSGEAPQHQMTALPVRFDTGPAPILQAVGWTPLRLGLCLAWIAAAVSLIAVWFGGWSLVDLSERRIRFVSAVTHELRTPLTSLRLYLDMLTSGMVKDEDQKQQYLTTLSHESNRLHQLIENVLDFAKLEKRAALVASQPVQVSDILNEIRETWQDRLSADGKELVIISTVPSNQAVKVDPRIAQQILGNLIDNARKYSVGAHDNRIWVWVKPAGKRVAFEVEDRGPGIPVAERRSIFRPFRRGGSSGATGGAGLGLALAKQWVESLSGRLSFRPADGGTGSCFRIEFCATA